MIQKSIHFVGLSLRSSGVGSLHDSGLEIEVVVENAG
jgi:hypothetical protein